MARISLADQYGEYQAALAAAGVKRRNAVEIAAAAVHSQLLELAPMIAWARPYGLVRRPPIPPLPSESELRAAVKADLKARGAWYWWQLGRWRLLGEEVARLRMGLQAAQAELFPWVAEGFRRFTVLEPRMTLLVLQSILADNGVPAAPVGVDRGDVLVLMSFPSPEALIWPEVVDPRRFPQVKVKKRTKAEGAALYKLVLLRYLLATGKEVLEAHPGIKAVRILAVDGNYTGPLSGQPVLAAITLRQADLAALRPPENYVGAWEALATSWERTAAGLELADVERVFFRAYELWAELRKAEAERFPGLIDRLDGRMTSSGQLSYLGTLGHLFRDVNFAALDLAADREADNQMLAATDHPVTSPLFWVDALSLAESWNSR